MSGSFGSAQWMYLTGFYPYEIDQSLRFNDDDTAYLSRTPASAGNRKTWTWSGWFKRANISIDQILFSCYFANNDSSQFNIRFNASNQFVIGLYNPFILISNDVFRDVSAWYHIVVALDTTEAASADRLTVTINNRVLSSFSTDNRSSLTLNGDFSINAAQPHTLGFGQFGTTYADGYMAEVNFIDGQALDATDFGEYKSDVWIPKSYSGTYGTNGFYLPFNDADFVGKDNSTVLGSDLVTNGSFDANVSDWSLNGFCTTSWLSSGKMQINRTGGTGPTAYQAIACEIGATYAIRVQLNSVGSRGDLRVNEAVDSGTILNLSGTNATTVDISGQFTATQTTHYLQFYVDSGGTSIIVDDVSVKKIISQGNDWTINNLAVTDQVPDSPTNNFATLNSIHNGTGLLSEGNLRHASAFGYGYVYGKSTIAIPETGKWVFEGYFLVTPTTNNYNSIGVTSNPNLAGSPFNASGNYGINDASSTYGQSFVQNGARQGSITLPNFTFIQVLVDRDNNQMTFVKDGVLQTGTGSTVAIPSSGLLFPVIGEYVSTQIVNFGQDSSFGGEVTAQGNTDANGIGDFYYAPPAGYLALCTANLPNPAINPEQDDVPADYFNTVLYTGNGSTQSITGVGFQPDFTWFKARSSAYDHQVVDVIRGAGNVIYTNLTDPEGTLNTVSSFDSDGFTVDGTTYAGTNGNGTTFVAWNWLAGNGTTSNTDGTITSTVSANEKAGFSIVSWTGDGVNNKTIGHGLSEAPQAIITKARSAAWSWYVWTDAFAATTGLTLNTADAVATFSYGTWGTKTSTTIEAVSGANGLANINASGTTYIAYCFNSVEGYSKIGSYTGNGSTDGPFVYTGFRPAFVITKSSSAVGSWSIYDHKRTGYNPIDVWLRANGADAESTSAISGPDIDILSNGFKLRSADNTLNANGTTYIYMAFAEMPFKYSNAR